MRISFVTKLLTAALLLCLVVIASVSGYLLVSRGQQADHGALTNAANRAATMGQVLERFVAAPAASEANALAAQSALINALAGGPAAVSRLMRSNGSAALSGTQLVVANRAGEIVFRQNATDLDALPPPTTPAVIAAALQPGAQCTLVRNRGQPLSGACGLEYLSDGQPSLDVAVPIVRNGLVEGVVGYIAPVDDQLQRFSDLFDFPTAYLTFSGTPALFRSGDLSSAHVVPNELRTAVAEHSADPSAIYDDAEGREVAGAFVPLPGLNGKTAAYIGLEAPTAQFLGDARTDIITLLLITLLVLLLTTVVVALFVNRAVRRPIAALERGVARIAGGEYDAKVAVHSNDELGRLATSVNSMGEKIADSVRQIDAARIKLSRAVHQAGDVSRALTTTTAGVAALQDEVARAAAAIVGGGALAVLSSRHQQTLSPIGIPAGVGESIFTDDELIGALLAGKQVNKKMNGRQILGVPMFYQDEVVGSLIVVSAPHAAGEQELELLAVLANNAAVAMENTRLLDQERETVRRLRELDSLKGDFLATVQHELRTPLTAIVGLSDLIEMCWDVWDDEKKLDSMADIQRSAKTLYDIVETIIDFTLVSGDIVGLVPQPVTLASAIEEAVQSLDDRQREGLPVPVKTDGDATTVVYADAGRFQQVIRALLDNAEKFSEGRGTVDVTWAMKGEMVEIAIRDQGIGMSEEERAHIFEQFYQADNSATRKYGGTGMGLALARRLVDAHGGSIDLTTKPGEGTTVTLLWPGTAAAAGGEAGRAQPSPNAGDPSVPRPVAVQ